RKRHSVPTRRSSDLAEGLAYSSDGKRITAALEDKSVTTWDSETGKELTTFKSFRGNFGAIALGADGRCLVATSEGQTVTLKKWEDRKSTRLNSSHGS